jgi:hypothetical protein
MTTEKMIRNTMILPGLTQNVEHQAFIFGISSMLDDKKRKMKEIWLAAS